jgi:acetyltransferase-like isoleucine patch superfamily enzyme
MQALRFLKRRFLEWIADGLAAGSKRSPVSWNALLAPTAVVGPEGQIENYTEDNRTISIGNYSYVRGRLLTYGHGGRITIGDWCYVGVRTEIWSMESVSIGNRVLISHDVNIHDGTAHSLDKDERHAHFRHIIEKGHPRSAEDLPGVFSGPVVIEDDVWISFGVSIMKGVRIGEGSVIAANSIVTKDVPPRTVYHCRVDPVMRSL